jgi:hypothetical protein
MLADPHNDWSDEEIQAYQTGLSDVVCERQSLSSVMRIAGRRDLQLCYAQGWVVGERLMDGVDPVGIFDDEE